MSKVSERAAYHVLTRPVTVKWVGVGAGRDDLITLN